MICGGVCPLVSIERRAGQETEEGQRRCAGERSRADFSVLKTTRHSDGTKFYSARVLRAYVRRPKDSGVIEDRKSTVRL